MIASGTENRTAMYVVHVDHPSSTATIHLVGGCAFQRKADSRTEVGDSEWSYPISSLREAQDFSVMSKKTHIGPCGFCQQSTNFGA